MNIEDLAEEFTEEESKQCLEKALALFTTISTKKSIIFIIIDDKNFPGSLKDGSFYASHLIESYMELLENKKKYKVIHEIDEDGKKLIKECIVKLKELSKYQNEKEKALVYYFYYIDIFIIFIIK